MKKIAMILLFAVSVTVSACQFDIGSGYEINGFAFPIITHVNDIPVTNRYEAVHEYREESRVAVCYPPTDSRVATNTPFRITVAWQTWYRGDLDIIQPVQPNDICAGLVALSTRFRPDDNSLGWITDPELLEKTFVLRMYLSEDDGVTWQLFGQRRFSSISLLNDHSRLLGGKIFPSGLGGTYPPGKKVKIRLQAACEGYESNPLNEFIRIELDKFYQTPWNLSIDHVVTVTITGERRPGEAY